MHRTRLSVEEQENGSIKKSESSKLRPQTLGLSCGHRAFLGVLIVLVVAQILAKKFHLVLYWATIVASTTFGTTMADFADRALGIGYTGGTSLLLACLTAVLCLWYWSERTISVNTVSTPKVEAFIGPPSPSHRRSAPLLVTRSPTPVASAIWAAR